MDLSLYTKIDEALHGMAGAFHSLVSAGLAREEEEELQHPAETLGSPVMARELGAFATQALQAIHRLKQTSIHSDWSELSESRDKIRYRLELEMVKHTQRINKLKTETQNLVQKTESHYEHFAQIRSDTEKSD